MVYMWAYFLINYKSLLAAIIAAVLISFSLVLGVAAVILNRATRRSQPWLAADAFAPDMERSYCDSNLSPLHSSQPRRYDEEIGLDFDATPRSTRCIRGVRVGSQGGDDSSRGGGEQQRGSVHSRWRL